MNLGAIAQLGERVTGSHEVRGSNPLSSILFAGAGRAVPAFFIMKNVSEISDKNSTLSGAIGLEELLRMIMDAAAELTGAEAGSILLLKEKTRELFFVVATGERSARLSDIKLRPGEGIAGWVAQTGKPAMVNDVSSDDRHASSVDIRTEFVTKSLLAVPMMHNGKVIGVLEAVNKRYGQFEKKDLTAFSAFAELSSVAINNTKKFEKLNTENKILREEAIGNWKMIGKSGIIKKLKELIEKVAPTTATVLITGESGTGKEVVAHMVHSLSNRANGPFVKVSCAAIPETLLESELFGHEKGAFTGANERRIGRFEAASGGTILLDEIGEITQSVQSKLLRVMQEKQFERLGGGKTLTTDARILAATNRNLRKSVEEGTFRDDLYYRLNVVPIQVAPLRDRLEDVPLLIEYFLKKMSKRFPHEITGVKPEAMQLMMNYDWPGNVRELENLIERCAVISSKEKITVELLPPEIRGETPLHQKEMTSNITLPEAEEMLMRKALERTAGNVSKASRSLDISRDRFRYRLKKFDIDPTEYR